MHPQPQASCGSMGGLSTSQAEDDSVAGSADDTDTQQQQKPSKKKRKDGLPPPAPGTIKPEDFFDMIDLPSGLSAEDQKKLKR